MSTEGRMSPSPVQSQELRSQLPSVNVTRLPASVTNLVDCAGHEIKLIEDEVNRYYDNEETNTITAEMLESLEDAIDDGFMCVDLTVLERKLEVWHRLFSPSFDNSKNSYNGNFDYTVTPFFAVKCNPDPIVVEWLARFASLSNLPLGFDCASITELELAKKCIEKYYLRAITATREDSRCTGSNISAIPISRIVYANPQRAEADLMRALELFASQSLEPEPSNGHPTSLSKSELWLTLDGIEEVYKIAITRKRFLKKHHSKRNDHQNALTMPQIRIILRIWVPDGHSQVPLGEKFGMRLDQIDSVVEACLEHGIDARDIIGISFHCGSGCESVDTYLEALKMGKTALALIDLKIQEQLRKLDETNSQKQCSQHRCWLLDIGGGFPGLDGLCGDKGRFAAGDCLAKTNHTIDGKNDDKDVIEDRKATVADIAVAVRPFLQSFAASNCDIHEDTSSKDFDNSEGRQHGEGMVPPLTIIAEPGRYFVEGAFALVSRIYQKQIQEIPQKLAVPDRNNSSTNGNDFIYVYRISHGVQGVFKDVLLCGESFIPKPLKMNNLKQLSELEKTPGDKEVLPQKELNGNKFLSRVLGPSGDDSEDVVCDSCWLPELEVGDWLLFDRMGAYTLSIASRAGRPVIRYVMGGGKDDAHVRK